MTTNPARRTARHINEDITYTVWSVFARTDPVPADAPQRAADVTAGLAEDGIEIRGWYDVSTLRADADALVWLHGPDPAGLQRAVRAIRRDVWGDRPRPVWSVVGVHRPAEFNKGHVPAFLTGAAAQPWLAVYPFVRSYEWYLLPEQERRDLLVEHGTMGRAYPSVLSNTVAAFALGDYEWILALESAQLHDIVDLMRHLRASGARRHVREETPFFTGRLVDAAGAADALR